MMRLVSLATLLALTVAPLGCQKQKQKPPAAPPEPVATVKAGDLIKEYRANALAADGKYKGKLIKVTGKFDGVQKAPLLGYVLQLLPEDAGEANLVFVQCFLAEEAHDEASKLQAGQLITVLGTCDGQTVSQVKMSKCTLAK